MAGPLQFSESAGYASYMQGFQQRMSNIQGRYQNDANKYVNRSMSELKNMASNTQRMFTEFYKQASLSQKRMALEQEQIRQQQIQQQVLALRSLTQEGTTQYNTLTNILNDSLAAQADAQQKSLKMQKALTEERYKALTPIQRANAIYKEQKEYQEQIAKIEAERRVALAAATTDEEKEQINKSADLETERLRSQTYGGGTKAEQFIAQASSSMSKLPSWVSAILEGLSSIAQSVHSAAEDSVNKTVSVYSQYMGRIDARLQGSNKSFGDITSLIQQRIGVSAYVNQQQLISDIAKLADAGVAYNLEQRAYLATLSDRMVSTFNVLDASLTRLIRLQQADVTAVSMGSEAALTQLLNNVFKDTSYLSDVYDSVSAAILDASSQLSAYDQTGYQYNVQKWLGSLYSTGMSSEAISLIAQGLNALTTGNVNQLSSNSSLQTLFGLAAQRSGMSYATILTQGLDASGVNTLMKSVVELLQDIVNNTSNQVTKAAWADILSMSVSDFRAITNLTQQDISSIYASTMSYDTALTEVANQLSQVVDRTHMQERIDNTVENIMFNWASDLVSDQERYKSWKISNWVMDMVSSATENIPLVGKLTSWITNIGQGINDLANLGLPDFTKLNLSDATALGLGTFDWDAYQSRGSLANVIAGYGALTGATRGVSYSAIVSRASADAQLANLASNVQESTIRAVSSDAQSTFVKTANDIYTKLFVEQVPVKVNVSGMEDAAVKLITEAVQADQRHKDILQLNDTITMSRSSDMGSAISAAQLSQLRQSF